MPRSSRSGTLSILQAAAIDDVRMGASALRMLVALGTYADREGWCWPKQRQLSERLGVSQQAVSKALRDLAGHGYIEVQDQFDGATGARLSSRYRLVMDFVLPLEFRRTPQPDVVGSQLQIVAPTTSEVVAPTTLDVVAPTTSEVVAIEERPNRTTQLNDPIDIPAECPERELFDYYRSKIQPAARINAPEKIRTRLKRFTVDELKAGIDHFAADHWWMENNATRGAAWFFDSDKRSEQFLNLKPRSKDERSGSAGSNNHAAPASAAPAGTSSSKWDGWKGRHGMTVSRAAGYEDDR
jgi:hypothetical protein